MGEDRLSALVVVVDLLNSISFERIQQIQAKWLVVSEMTHVGRPNMNTNTKI